MAIGSLLSAPGIGSGLDVKSIVTKLLGVERRPLLALQSQATSYQVKLSAVGTFKSLSASLQDALNALSTGDVLKGATATSSDPAFVSATSAASAAAATYAVLVQSLASSQTLVSAAGVFTSASAVVGSGMLSIQLGTFSSAQTTFAAKPGASALSIAINSTNNMLTGVGDAINASKSGVTASLISDTTGVRLLLSSAATGPANGFTVAVVESGAPGLGRLGYNPPAAVSQLALSQAGANSAATINGVAVSSDTNTLSGVVQGTLLILNKVTTTPVVVTVGPDTERIKGAIANFASKYNDVINFLSAQTRYDAATKRGSLLQGDSTLVAVQRQLGALTAQQSTASVPYATLSSIGLETQKDGTLRVNATKLAAAVANLPELTKALCTVGTGPSSGLATRLTDYTAKLLDTNGALTLKAASLQSFLKSNDTDQARVNNRLAAIEQRLRKTYAALDPVVNKYTALNGYLAQHFRCIEDALTLPSNPLNHAVSSGDHPPKTRWRNPLLRWLLLPPPTPLPDLSRGTRMSTSQISRVPGVAFGLVAASAALLVACGGGGTSSGTPKTKNVVTTVKYAKTFSAGRIGGFGSIVINGVHYDEITATVTDDDGMPHPASDLKLGMEAEVVASNFGLVDNGATGGPNMSGATAQSIVFKSALQGPIASIDTVAGTVTVLGQVVKIDAATVFDTTLRGGLSSLKINDIIKVFGLPKPGKAGYTATRIEPLSNATEFALRGCVTALNPTAKTLNIGNTLIDVSAVALPDTMAVGSVVRFKLLTTAVNGTWVASGEKDAADQPQDNDHTELEGTITALRSATSFSVDGQMVDGSGVTLDPNVNLAVGAHVEVQGAVVKGVLVAASIKVASDQDVQNQGFDVDGIVTALDTSKSTFVVRDTTVSFAGSVSLTGGVLTDLKVGSSLVEVHGSLAADGVTLNAMTISMVP